MVVILSAAALFSNAYQGGLKSDLNPSLGIYTGDRTDSLKIYDEGLLKQFELVCSELDGSHDKIAFSGTVYMHDKADTLNKPQTLPFKMCREGNELYYQLGRTEMINSNEYYIFTDHDAERVVISEAKHLATGNIADIRKMKEALSSEEYEMKSSMQGNQKTISLVNENHITCKEYAVTFDAASYSVKRFFMRFSNMDDPLKKGNEKIIDIRITDKGADPDVTKYLDKHLPVIKEDAGWKLKQEYTQYQLIRL